MTKGISKALCIKGVFEYINSVKIQYSKPIKKSHEEPKLFFSPNIRSS